MGDTLPRVGGHSPWGAIDHVRQIATGVVSVSTPGHGGLWLSPARRAAFTRAYPGFLPFTGSTEWLEEDIDAALYLAAFPLPDQGIPQDDLRAYVSSPRVQDYIRRRTAQPASFDPHDCGGAFDGFTVTSDADPGL